MARLVAERCEGRAQCFDASRAASGYQGRYRLGYLAPAAECGISQS